MYTKPVSAKFYDDIFSRISSTLSSHPYSLSEARRIVDAYLDGYDPYTPDPYALIVFSMLKDEIDRAITRSARARESARKRLKTKASAASQPAAPAPESPVRVMLQRREGGTRDREEVERSGNMRSPAEAHDLPYSP